MVRIFIVTGLLLLTFAGCSKSDDSAKSAKEKRELLPDPEGQKRDQAVTAPAKRPEGPTGSLVGKVFLNGQAPEMPLLQRGSDPGCSQGEVRAETIITGEGGSLANVLVRIKPGTVPGWVPSEVLQVDQVDCMYRPRVMGGVRGQTVRVGNSDTTTHNVHARNLPLGKRQDIETLLNRAQPAGVSVDFVLGDEEVAKLKCDYHGWMQGYVVVSDNPYFAVSDAAGTFKLEGLPVGKHQFQAWHEYYGVKTAEVTVEEGKEATVEFRFDAEADKPGATSSAPASGAEK